MNDATAGIGDLVSRLIESGADPKAAAMAVAQAFELGAHAAKPVVSPRQARNARYYAENRDKILAQQAAARTARKALSEIQTPQPEVAKSPRETKRGTRLAAEWKPTEDMVVFASELGFAPSEIARLAEEFRDYWLGVPGRHGTKQDWPATWRNRCREIAGRRGLTGPPTLFAPNTSRNNRQHNGQQTASSIDYSPDATRRAAIADATFAGVARTTRRLVEKRMAERENRTDAAQGADADAAAEGRDRARHCGTAALPAPRPDADGEPGGDGGIGRGAGTNDEDVAVAIER